MSIYNFQSNDFQLATGTNLKVSAPLSAAVANKPSDINLTVDPAGAALGATIITLTAASDILLPKNLELKFTGGISVITDEEKVIAATPTTLAVQPLEVALAGAETYLFDQLFDVYSINQADSTINQNELEDRNFRSGLWVSRRVTHRTANLSLSGVYVKNDPGFKLIRQASRTNQRIYFILQESETTEIGLQGFAFVTDLQITRQNDQHVQVSFNLNVDGELLDYVAA